MNIERERAAFEAFALGHGLCVTEDGDLYRSHVVAWMWMAWQARSALQAECDQPRKDEARLDWLADPNNHSGNVELPQDAVLRNPHSLRDAIDDAMEGEYK